MTRHLDWHDADVISDLVETGQLVEAGFAGLVVACNLTDAPPEKLQSLRVAFFAGAQHLLRSMDVLFEQGCEEPTEEECLLVDQIAAELDRFVDELDDTTELRHTTATVGNA